MKPTTDTDAGVTADTGAVAVLERPEDDRIDGLPAVWQRLASVNSKRALGTLLVLVLLALTLAVPVRTYLAQRGEFNRLQAENEQLAHEVDHYQRRVTEQNDPAYIENQARDRLQYVMPGEKPVVLTYPYRDRRQAEEQKAREYAANPWYQNLWDAVSTPPEGQ
ncbi:septum formation initiator family protein [Gordonia caeni]|uniref:Septum formation initiator family protein n=1 Tax=Gordonia caeni TaxID=1007097 RepID=A0ABP7PIA4_9ACTN